MGVELRVLVWRLGFRFQGWDFNRGVRKNVAQRGRRKRRRNSYLQLNPAITDINGPTDFIYNKRISVNMKGPRVYVKI